MLESDLDFEGTQAERKHKQEHLEALEVFMESPAFAGYKAARQTEIVNLSENIVAAVEDCADLKGLFEIFILRGELRSQREMSETFEVARETLKARIDEIVELENEIATKPTIK